MADTPHSPISGSLEGPDKTNSGKQAKGASSSGRTVLVGLLGGVASAVGYAVYQRLPDDQREKLHGQVKGVINSRLNELRSNLNL